MNVLITGGYGFIGSYLYNQLNNQPERLKDNWNIIQSSKNGFYSQLDKKFDIIYHLAAYSRVPGSNLPENHIFENNIVSLQQSLELARQTGAKLVFTSTSYCNVSKNANYYAFSKHIGEQLCEFYHKTYNVDVAVVRLFNVYGNQISNYPQWKLGVIDKFLLDKSLGAGYIINNTGEQRRDYVHISDVVSALIILGFNKTNPLKLYEVGTGETYSVNEIAKMIFGDMKPLAQIKVSGEIMNSQSLGGIQHMIELGWKHKINLTNFLKS